MLWVMRIVVWRTRRLVLASVVEVRDALGAVGPSEQVGRCLDEFRAARAAVDAISEGGVS